MKNLQEGTDGFLDAFFITALNALAKSDAFADFFVPIGVLELVVKCFRQVVGNEPVATGQKFTAVFFLFSARYVGCESIHDRQVKLSGQWLKKIMLNRINHLADG